MNMEDEAFIEKYESQETEVIPRAFLKETSHNYFTDGPVICKTCNAQLGDKTDQYFVDLMLGEYVCDICWKAKVKELSRFLILNLKHFSIVYSNTLIQTVYQLMPAPYISAEKNLSINIEGLNQYLNNDLLSLLSYSLLTFEIENNSEWSSSRNEIFENVELQTTGLLDNVQ